MNSPQPQTDAARILQVVSGMMYGGGQRVVEGLLAESKCDGRFRADLCLLGTLAVNRFRHHGHQIPYDGRYNRPGVLVKAGLELRRLLSASQFDLIHTHGWDADVIGAIAVSGTSLSHVAHQHIDWPIRKGVSRVVRSVLTWLAMSRRETHVIAVSSATADSFARAVRFRRSSIRVIRNGIDMARYPRTPPRQQGASFVLGCVARLAPMKGLEYLIRAIRGVRAPKPIELRLAGAGGSETSLRSLASQVGIRAIFEGHLDDVPEFYRQIDAFILPSVSLEGLPLTLLEAMAAGLPVIATDVGGIREAFEDGIHGFLVRPRNESDLSQAIEKLAADPSLRAEMGRSAREHAHANFGQERFASEVFALYRDVLSGKGG